MIEKLKRSRAVLSDLVPTSGMRDFALQQLHADIVLLTDAPAESIGQLLGVEARSAFAYFRCWCELPVAWKGTKRHPIPDDWNRVGPRASARRGKTNQLALHPVQAMLNYAYAVLEGQIRVELVRFGFNPMVSFLHSIRPDRASLVLDVLEPCRAIADRAILRFVRDQMFSPADVTLNADGVCRLHPQLARRVAGLVDVSEEIGPLLLQLVRKLGFQPNKRPSAKLDSKLDVRLRSMSER